MLTRRFLVKLSLKELPEANIEKSSCSNEKLQIKRCVFMRELPFPASLSEVCAVSIFKMVLSFIVIVRIAATAIKYIINAKTYKNWNFTDYPDD